VWCRSFFCMGESQPAEDRKLSTLPYICRFGVGPQVFAVRVIMFLSCSSNLLNRQLCSRMVGCQSSTYGSCLLYTCTFSSRTKAYQPHLEDFTWCRYRMQGIPGCKRCPLELLQFRNFYFTMHKPYTGRIPPRTKYLPMDDPPHDQALRAVIAGTFNFVDISVCNYGHMSCIQRNEPHDRIDICNGTTGGNFRGYRVDVPSCLRRSFGSCIEHSETSRSSSCRHQGLSGCRYLIPSNQPKLTTKPSSTDERPSKPKAYENHPAEHRYNALTCMNPRCTLLAC